MNAPSQSRTKKVALLVILLCALTALLIYNWRSNRFNESELRDTAGIQVNITKSQQTPQGILIVYTIENHSQKTASSIVLTAQVRDNSDKPIAANPLINILTLSPGQKRTQNALAPYLPNAQPTSTFKPILQTTLVRWME
ncbi:MAG: hypothetical protein IT447_06465 [Phycisphaerales bacterium]|jgi:uncharacterized protein (TIGR02588 family)|nr:hypothetical protein [Phycisphaerales bacterium]